MGVEQPQLKPIGDGKYRLQKPYVYHWKKDGRKYKLVVPEGFITDGASVPRFLWSVTGITPYGLHIAAAVIHDFLYHYKGEVPSGHFFECYGSVEAPLSYTFSRKEADRMFGRILRESGVGKFRRRSMVLAVRSFGWVWWKT